MYLLITSIHCFDLLYIIKKNTIQKILKYSYMFYNRLFLAVNHINNYKNYNLIFLLFFCFCFYVRHVVLAPSYFDTKSNSQFPGITDSIQIARESGERKDWERVKKQISMVIHAFRSAVSVLSPPD